jgi:hypothetical protein
VPRARERRIRYHQQGGRKVIFQPKGLQTAAAKTVLGLISTATIRPRVKFMKAYQVGVVSVDSETEILCSRITTAGTSTALTLAGSDSVDPTATLIAGSNYSAEPTYTANTLEATMVFNPRGQGTWQPYDATADILLPPTASNGLGCLLNTLGGSTTVYVEATVQQ